jgi:hypothetical protein
MILKEEQISWILKKRKLRKQYIFLTEKDLKYDESQQDAMLIKLSKRLGKTKEQLQAVMEAP